MADGISLGSYAGQPDTPRSPATHRGGPVPESDSATPGASRSRRPQSQYVLGEVRFSSGEPVLDRFLKSSGSSMKLSDGAV